MKKKKKTILSSSLCSQTQLWEPKTIFRFFFNLDRQTKCSLIEETCRDREKKKATKKAQTEKNIFIKYRISSKFFIFLFFYIICEKSLRKYYTIWTLSFSCSVTSIIKFKIFFLNSNIGVGEVRVMQKRYKYFVTNSILIFWNIFKI